jgi:putative ABC transport system permease protein
VSGAILTDSYWRRWFHADPSLLGRTISLNGRARTVIGILGADFRFPEQNTFAPNLPAPSQPEIFVPKVFAAEELRQLLGTHNYGVIARLRPGVSREQAVVQLEAVQVHLVDLAGEKMILHALVVPLLESVAGRSRTGLLALMGAIAVLLLIVCVNLTNLLLARAERRGRELAVRAALGASRAALIRHGLAESLVLAIGGGLLAAAVAAGGLALLKTHPPTGIPRLDEVALDGRVIGFASILAAFTAVVFGALPAWRAGRSDPQDMLRSTIRGGTASAGAMQLRGVLVASEVGLSAVLLILAGTLINSFVRVTRADKGFHAPTVLAVDIGLPRNNYQQETARDGFYRRLFAAIAAQPGVQSAAISSALPLQGETWIDGISANLSAPEILANVRFVSPGYFDTMGVPLPAGRSLNEGDRGHDRIVISKRLASSLWPGQNPIGRRCTCGNNQWFEVIGVAGDVRAESDRTPVAMLYRGYWDWMPYRTVLVARATGAPHSIAGALRAAIHAKDADIPVPTMRTMSEVFDASVGTRRFQMLLAGAFAVMALLVDSFGIYAVVSYSVARRTGRARYPCCARRTETRFVLADRTAGHDTGWRWVAACRRRRGGLRTCRSALGARAGDLLGMVLRESAVVVSAGLALGMLGAMLAGWWMSGVMFGVSPWDPVSILAASALVPLAALAGCWRPARRATMSNAMEMIREDSE